MGPEDGALAGSEEDSNVGVVVDPVVGELVGSNDRALV